VHDTTHSPHDDRLRATLGEQFGKYCVTCGSTDSRLHLVRLNRARPHGMLNSVLRCEDCEPSLSCFTQRFSLASEAAKRRARWKR
jgi:hypothetical protein